MMRGLVCLAILVGALQAGPAAEAGPRYEYEYVLKAQILVELMPYVQWPGGGAPAQRPFVLGVLGRSPFGSSLESYARTRTIQRRPVQIRYGRRVEDLEGCEAIFICPSDAEKAEQVVAWARERHVLTVADAGNASRLGVLVVLLLEGDYVRLVVNLPAASSQGFTFGSLLLRNARIVGAEANHP